MVYRLVKVGGEIEMGERSGKSAYEIAYPVAPYFLLYKQFFV